MLCFAFVYRLMEEHRINRIRVEAAKSAVGNAPSQAAIGEQV